MPRVALVTGLPTSFLATRVVEQLLMSSPNSEIRCVVQEKSLPRAREILEGFRKQDSERVTILEGDCAAMDLGLSGAEFNRLAAEVNVVHHCAAITYLGVDRKIAEEVNVGGAREILELAERIERNAPE